MRVDESIPRSLPRASLLLFLMSLRRLLSLLLTTGEKKQERQERLVLQG